MQHLENQQPEHENRTLHLQERWNTISEALQLEDNQRSEYVMDSLSELQNRVSKYHLIQESKRKVHTFQLQLIEQELGNLKRQCFQVNQIALAGPSKQNEARATFENKTSFFINQYQQKADEFNREASSNIDRRIKDITMNLSQNSRTVIQKTQDAVKEIQRETDELKQFIAHEKKKAAENLEVIKDTVSLETAKIEKCIDQLRRDRLQNEQKVDSMIQDLDALLYGIVDEELKSGEVTYQCLLKLFEDTCCKMEATIFNE